MYYVKLYRNRPEWHTEGLKDLNEEMQEFAFNNEPEPEEELNFQVSGNNCISACSANCNVFLYYSRACSSLCNR